MTLNIAAVTFDCEHATELATFWSVNLDAATCGAGRIEVKAKLPMVRLFA
jgi:hypothetical protein